MGSATDHGDVGVAGDQPHLGEVHPEPLDQELREARQGMALTGTVYRVPAASMRGRAVVTNTSPTTPYRGGHEVLPPELEAIESATARGEVDQPGPRRRPRRAAPSARR
jgi:hypothetical protein